MNGVLEQPLADTFRCTWTLYDQHNRPYFCGRPIVAVFDGPLGRLPRCIRHERPAQSDPAYRAVQL